MAAGGDRAVPAPGRGASSGLPSLWSRASLSGRSKGACGLLLPRPSGANVSLTGGVSTPLLRVSTRSVCRAYRGATCAGPATAPAAWQAQKRLLVPMCYSWSRNPSERSGCLQTRPLPLRRHLDPILGPRCVPFILALFKNTFLFVSAESLPSSSSSSGSPRHPPGAGRSPVPSAWLPQAGSFQTSG